MSFKSGLGQGMGLGTGCLLFVVLLMAGCGALFVRGTGATTEPSQTPSTVAVTATPVPTPHAPYAPPTPTPYAAPTSTPKPTLRPAALKFGTLGYTANGCWSSNYTDAEGHAISGVLVDFSVNVKNSGQTKSAKIPLSIVTTDWFTTTPTLFKANWKGVSWSGDDMSAEIDGPQLGPGKSTILRWSVLFQTPFDFRYTLDSASDARWSLWTSATVCY